MKIFFDHKIFVHQKYGGPSRYFVNLVNELNTINSINAKIFAPVHINNFLNSLDKSNIRFAKKMLFNDKISTSPKPKKNLGWEAKNSIDDVLKNLLNKRLF